MSDLQAIAIVLVLITAIIFAYRSDAVGSGVSVSTSIPRAKNFIPLIGHTLELLPNGSNYQRIYHYLLRETERFHGKPFLINLPFTAPMIVTHDPKNMEYILKTRFDNFVKGKEFHQKLAELLGSGIFASDGDTWKTTRKTAANIFTTSKFKTFVEDVFRKDMTLFKERLAEFARSAKEADLQDLFFRFTLDSFAEVGFGVSTGSLVSGKVPFADAFDHLQSVMDERFINPFWKFTELFFGRKKALCSLQIVKNFGSDMVSKRRKDVNLSSKCDLLSLFMNALDKDGNQYSDSELAEHAINFIIAGRDTTAQALSWTVFYLITNAGAMEKLLGEIDATLGDAENPTYDQIKGMKYANAVFHEALRLAPSVPKNLKLCLSDDVLPDGTHIPKGANILFSTWCMARDKSIWGSDAETFKPERWIDAKIPNQFEYLVFNAGPRVCLGKTFAELEGVFALVSIFRNYQVTLSDPKSIIYGNSLTLPMKNGLKCFISVRK